MYRFYTGPMCSFTPMWPFELCSPLRHWNWPVWKPIFVFRRLLWMDEVLHMAKRELESSQSTHLFLTLNCMRGDCTGSWIWVIALSESGCYLSQKFASAMWELFFFRNSYKTHPNQQINRFMDIHWHFMMSWPLQRSMLSCWQNQENPQRQKLMVPGLQGWRRFEQVGSHQAMRQLSNALKLLRAALDEDLVVLMSLPQPVKAQAKYGPWLDCCCCSCCRRGFQIALSLWLRDMSKNRPKNPIIFAS